MSDLEFLQYPVGRFISSGPSSAAEREESIATLATLPEKLARAIDGLTDAQLDTPYRPQGWTVRQLVHHIADSHMNAYSRCRHAMTTEWPTIFAYDQTAWAKLEDYALPVDASMKIITGLHARFVVMLRAVPEGDWAARGYVHPENGRQTLDQVLPLYAWHSRHHLAHVVNCRERLGW